MTPTTRRARTIQPLLALLAAAATLALLIATRPSLGTVLSNDPGSWRADDLAAVGIWWGAAVGSAWLAATTLACVTALARGRARSAHRIARFAPPVGRRALQAALVSTWALVPAAAYAAPPSAPITVHVDARGRLTTTDPPVVRTPENRTPKTRPTTTTTTRAATVHPTTTTTSTPTTAPSVSVPPNPPPTVTRPDPSPVAVPSPTPVAGPASVRRHVVVPGDNLWQIARAEVMRVQGSNRADDAQIAPYWQRVIAANRSTLRSGDPSLIFPGEVVTLP